jgi:uncharacterized protein
MKPASYWIEHLSLLPHPEGGFYKENYRSSETIASSHLPSRYEQDRSLGTSIYFLLRSEDRSVFHRLKSDEIWHFYAGTAATIYFLNNHGVSEHVVGDRIEKGESLQVVIPAGTWFSAEVKTPDSYCLVGCTVAPGFDFSDFEMGRSAELIHHFPGQEVLIKRFTAE